MGTILASVVILICAATSTAQEYKVYDLGSNPLFPDGPAVAYAVNNAGAVVGKIGLYGFRWTLADGFRYTTPTPYTSTSDSFAISHSGIVVGQFRRLSNIVSTGYLRNPSGPTVLIPSYDERSSLTPAGVNDSGEVVGQFSDQYPVLRAFHWSPSSGLVDIGSLVPGSQTVANAINSTGLVVGISAIGNFHYGAFKWTVSSGMVSIQPWFGYNSCGANAVNERGDVLVWSGGDFMTDHTHVLSLDGTLRAISPVVPGHSLTGQCMNNRGDVAGIQITDSGTPLGFVSSLGQPSVFIQDHLDASSQGWSIFNANGINDNGWLVGVGRRSGQNRAYVAIPVEFLKLKAIRKEHDRSLQDRGVGSLGQ